MSNAPHIICLSESRIKTNTGITTNISLPGYNFLHYDTPTNAGGSAIHVDASLRFEIMHSLNLHLEGCEDLWIKLIDYNTIIGSIYRHPKNNTNSFIETLSQKLSVVKNCCFYILGDMNINLLGSDLVSNEFINMFPSYYPISLIIKPTRVAASSATLLDLIVTNDTCRKINP